MSQDSHIQVGHIQGVLGIKGWLKVFSHCRPKEQILDYANWELRSSSGVVVYELQEGKLHSNGVVVKFQNINDRSQAELLKGSEIWVAKSELSDLEDDEFYWFQLEGLKVLTLEGEDLGQVKRMMETGANDVMVVRNKTDKQEILIPYVREQVIKEVDLDKNTIIVDWQKNYLLNDER